MSLRRVTLSRTRNRILRNFQHIMNNFRGRRRTASARSEEEGYYNNDNLSEDVRHNYRIIATIFNEYELENGCKYKKNTIDDDDIILLLPNPCLCKNINDYYECPICFDEVGPENGGILSCGHCYHNICIQKWFQKDVTCPICRVEDNPYKYIYHHPSYNKKN